MHVGILLGDFELQGRLARLVGGERRLHVRARLQRNPARGVQLLAGDNSRGLSLGLEEKFWPSSALAGTPSAADKWLRAKPQRALGGAGVDCALTRASRAVEISSAAMAPALKRSWSKSTTRCWVATCRSTSCARWAGGV